MEVAFIGLGIMGSRMAANLLKKNKALTVFNRSAGPIQKLAAQGAIAADSYRDAVKDAEVVFTMLPLPEVIETVAFSKDGFVPEMKKNAIWVDCSTVNPSFSRKNFLRAKKSGIRFMDAPVSGTKPNAENADLTFIVGAEKSDLEAVRPLLEYMGQKIMHVGEPGKGTAFKMLVNSLLAQSMLALSENILLGEQLGFSRDFLLDTLPKMSVCAPFTQAKAEMIRKDDFEVQFPLEWMHKDLHLAALTAYEQGQPLPLANLAKELYAAAKQDGLGRKDFSAIYQFMKN
ncbi:NAD(P)-dependent oxidoreductase [Desulfobacter hydrogenophilus]|uniref:NAD(P)-dependent oxidoreductase n=1 Tax=Desulfobacter hydrogenophilus TaxID=2291 RepID=A0A328FKB8_9BACT|nr:NAD(P)-dependent oxidoreductase [Desulfobacter hydrogenophilus]NDY71375.1 NAD(P)-dependent oxidoreductase [Desulfobacter hydrogenophilus]QBH12227.1 NAD(P)-dependent oxidoreductase [Desulfobacter hydrogenophilus]RAM03447.1 NAD(P)-dependent oxidoreductase [Desulfobacter hydrogenophilus]